jgi:hypothetical protein
VSRRIALTKRLSGDVKGERSNDESIVQIVGKSGVYWNVYKTWRESPQLPFDKVR